jgi:sulfur-oxidizing protein SoxB
MLLGPPLLCFMASALQITLVQINDTHGYLEPHPELVWTAEGAAFPEMGG